MSKRLYIRYSVYDADTEECLISDAHLAEDHKALDSTVRYCDTDIPNALVYNHYFNIKVSTLEEHNE